MAVLELDRLTVRHKDAFVLVDVSMAVEKAEIVGVLGPPEAGKSTLIQAVTGVRPPDHGTITLLGKDITHGREDKREEAGLARTVDSSGLLSVTTVREHLLQAFDRGSWVSKGRRLIGRKGESRSTGDVMEALELAPHADRQLGTLPLALRRRFELARALARDPAVVVADGLTLGLHSQEASDFVRLCRVVRDLGDVAMLVTDRNPDLILEVSDYAYVLDSGSVLARGDPEAIRRRSEVADALARSSASVVNPGIAEPEVTGRPTGVPPPRQATARTHAERLEAALEHFHLRKVRARRHEDDEGRAAGGIGLGPPSFDD